MKIYSPSHRKYEIIVQLTEPRFNKKLIFDLIFYCYYAFPTDTPEEIRKIFGREFFNQVIEPEVAHEFKQIIRDTAVEAAVTFNKGIFNLVSNDQVDHYIERLVEGELIQSQIKAMDRSVPIFLTFPTGWRYRKGYRELRKASLDIIRSGMSSRTMFQKQL